LARSDDLELKLVALEDAIASGVLRVKYSDREIWYNSVEEMKKAYEFTKGLLNKDSRKTKRVKMTHDKGLS